MLLFCLWCILLAVFTGIPCSYFLYLKRYAQNHWNLNIDDSFLPNVTIMVPMYNEESVIELKLMNLAKLNYPKDRLQVLLVNDGSTDNTMEEISDFLLNSPIGFTVINNESRQGKTPALNNALKYAKGDVVIVSDSDAFLSPDILYKAMPYFSDQSVGALISREMLLNPEISWVSETERLYFDLVYGTIKLGESKIHSTIMFHGGFAAYRKSLLDKFNIEADDTGTALDIVQKGKRAIMVPEAICYTFEFSKWKDKFNIKVRRGMHNLKTWFRCLRLLMKRELCLPLRIVLPEIFLYVINPIIFLALLIASILLILQNPLLMLFFSSVIIIALLIKKTRILLCEVIQNNLFLLLAILNLLLKRQLIRWETAKNPREEVPRETLSMLGLI